MFSKIHRKHGDFRGCLCVLGAFSNGTNMFLQNYAISVETVLLSICVSLQIERVVVQFLLLIKRVKYFLPVNYWFCWSFRHKKHTMEQYLHQKASKRTNNCLAVIVCWSIKMLHCTLQCNWNWYQWNGNDINIYKIPLVCINNINIYTV